jgi:MarR family transcriptional regulator for hemolysin
VRLLDKLEEKGWIARVASTDDRRRKYSVLTPKAAEQVRLLESLSEELRSSMMAGLTTQQLDQCSQTMTRIRDNLYGLQDARTENQE